MTPQIGFNAQEYEKLQRQAVVERIRRFSEQTLYLEVGGHLINDEHAARVLPGFDPYAKVRILRPLLSNASILFCVNMKDLINRRRINADAEAFEKESLETLATIEKAFGIKPTVILNFYPQNLEPTVQEYVQKLTQLGYKYSKRYPITNYPEDIELILGPNGFGKDDYIAHSQQLILVTGVASNSGKFSTCLGQLWNDKERDIKSAYAKYELFPIYNLPLEHPVNLAYEAATIDIGDYNCLDHYHEEAYQKQAVNYNRDVEAFELLSKIDQNYKSPTDMGINEAGFAIENDYVVAQSGLEEIQRRKQFYQDLLDKGEGKEEWVKRAGELERMALNYLAQAPS